MKEKQKNNPIQEINQGALVCYQLKRIYYDDVPWSDCSRKIASQFTALKIKMRECYPDKPTDWIVKELSTYSDDDIREFYEQ